MTISTITQTILDSMDANGVTWDSDSNEIGSWIDLEVENVIGITADDIIDNLEFMLYNLNRPSVSWNGYAV